MGYLAWQFIVDTWEHNEFLFVLFCFIFACVFAGIILLAWLFLALRWGAVSLLKGFLAFGILIPLGLFLVRSQYRSWREPWEGEVISKQKHTSGGGMNRSTSYYIMIYNNGRTHKHEVDNYKVWKSIESGNYVDKYAYSYEFKIHRK